MERSKKQVRLLGELKDFKRPFDLAQRNIYLPGDHEQTDLWGEQVPYRQLGIFGAYCFERIAGAMLGGYHHHGCVTHFHNGKQEIGYQPDVADHKNRIYTEVKACVWGTDTKLIQEQLQTHCNWVLYSDPESDNPENPPKCHYVFFRHNIKHAENRGLTRSAYLEELVKGGILYGIKVPLAIPLSFFIPQPMEKPHGFPTRIYCYCRQYDPVYRGYAEKHIMSVSTRFLNMLVSNPEETLELIGFKSRKFSFSRSKVKGLRINRKQVHQFPFISIDFKDEGKEWLETSREQLREFSRERVYEDSLPRFHSEDAVFGEKQLFLPTEEQMKGIVEVPFDIPPPEEDGTEEEPLF
ncbi:MAG: hypothetical protein WC796_04490 [Candidatus Pacearchaeota archaeon]|jgi:hypothetical protein